MCGCGTDGGLRISVDSRQSVPSGEDLKTFYGWIKKVSFGNVFKRIWSKQFLVAFTYLLLKADFSLNVQIPQN